MPQASDDLTLIEGIGPKTADTLSAAGISTFERLAASSQEELEHALSTAGGRLNRQDPTTWPAQAQLAAAGRMDELEAMQQSLDAGRLVDEPSE